MLDHSKKIIVITGPTASGKSRLAESIYRKVQSVIINADALQVYNALPILTAKPVDFKDWKKYRIYDALSFDEECSVACWLEILDREVQDAWSRNTVPIVVGGTGFYIRALLYGLSEVPVLDSQIVETVGEQFKELGRNEFYNSLCIEDPKVKNKIHEQDTYRILRAAAVLKQTGKSIYDYAEKKVDLRYKSCLHVCLDPVREVLYKWCNDRFTEMLNMGVVDEVKEFICTKKANKNYAVEKAIGYKQLAMYLNREISLSDATELTQRLTRNYAKRQCTWFRNQLSSKISINYIDYFKAEKEALEIVDGFI
jgi:tRNA dimethylallyltransferase